MNDTSYTWLEPGRYIDVKDKYGDWLVGFVIQMKNGFVKVRMDGWQSKYDEIIAVGSTKLKPFRSRVRGYTGQMKNPAIREHMKFNIEIHNKKLNDFKEFTEHIEKKNEDQINQFIRGSHYFYIDFLLTYHYKSVVEAQTINEYLYKHIFFMGNFLQMLKNEENLLQRYNNASKDYQAFINSHFQIFDATCSIMQTCPRLRKMFKSNQEMILAAVSPLSSNLQQIIKILTKTSAWQNYLKVWKSISNITNQLKNQHQEKMVEKSPSNKLKHELFLLPLIRSLLHLYFAFEKLINSSDQKKQFVSNIAQILILFISNIPLNQENENDVEQIYRISKQIYCRYTSAIYSFTPQLLRKLELFRLKIWKNLIETQSLQKKLRGINKIKVFWESISGEEENRIVFMIYTEPQTFIKWARRQIQHDSQNISLFQAIFGGCEHQQVIRKGCELVSCIYNGGGVGFSEIKTIWQLCSNKNQVVKKTLYQFMEKIIPKIKANETDVFVDLICQMNIVDQTDISFFQIVLQMFVQQHEDHPATKNLLFFAFTRQIRNYSKCKIEDDKSGETIIVNQLDKFSKSLAMSSLNSQHLRFYVGMIFEKKDDRLLEYVSDIKLESSKIQGLQAQQMKILLKKVSYNYLLKLLLGIYERIDNKQLDLDENSMYILISKLVSNISEIVKLCNKNHEKYKKICDLTENNVSAMLKIIEFMQKQEFQFLEKDLHSICQAFYGDSQKHKQLQINILYKWILQSSKNSFFPLINYYTINHCLSAQLCSVMFKNYLTNSSIIDYINLSLQEYIIIYNFFMDINVYHKNIKMICHKLTGYRCCQTQQLSNIYGLNELWKIFMNARNPDVMQQVIKNLGNIYINCQQDRSVEGLQKLLLKLQKTLNDSKKRSNTRLIKYCLYFIQQTILAIKQQYLKFPKQYKLDNKIYSTPKKPINLIYKNKVYQIKMCFADPLSELLKQASHISDIPIYSFNLFTQKQANTLPPKQSHVHLIYQKIPKQYVYLPIFYLLPSAGLSAGAEQSITIKIEEKINNKYQFLKKFFSQKLQDVILKILSSDSASSRQCSQFSYNILVHIPTHRSKTQILKQLLEQINSKNIKLKDHCIHYRMYLIKVFNNICLNQCQKDIQQVKKFLKENQEIYRQILEHICIGEVTERIQAEILIQLLNGLRKIIDNIQKKAQKADIKTYLMELKFDKFVNVQTLMNLALEITNFVANKQQSHQIENSKSYSSDPYFFKVFVECLNIVEILQQTHQSNILDLIIQTGCLEKLLRNIFINNLSYYKKYFVKLFQRLAQSIISDPYKQALHQSNQQQMFEFIFGQIYENMSTPQQKKPIKFDASAFSLIRSFIKLLSFEKIEELVSGQNSFYRGKCIRAIEKYSDNHRQIENIYFQGHLQLINILISKKHDIIDDDLTNLILFECLIYKPNKNQDLHKIIKCRNQNSIKACLHILEKIMLYNQQLRKYILQNLMQAQQITQYKRNYDSWQVNIENQYKSTTGYVGMDNPGCICYLNSLMQVLFNNKRFRKAILEYEPCIRQIDKTNNVLMAVKKLFIDLQYSDLKHISPVSFSKSIRTQSNKPIIKLFEQMDIQQFSSILFDKIQKQIIRDEQLLSKKLHQGDPAEKQNFIKKIFEGRYSNQIISQQCQHSSQRQEHFISMQLDVKPSLDMALKSLVEGEILDGENKYHCEKCDKKVRALKRLSIKKLPDSLLVCLKRFEYNFEYDAKIKVNSYCQFKDQFCFLPYMQEYLNNRQQQIKQKEYYTYKLKGVVIHSGSSDNGHYYAFLEGDQFLDDKGMVRKWYEFNDTYVNQFDKNKIPEEAYGNKDEEDVKNHNAYMLVYEKIKPEQDIDSDQVINLYDNFSKSTKQNIQKVQLSNRQIHISQLLFGKQYQILVRNLVNSQKLTSMQNLMLFVSYVFHVSMRQQNFMHYIDHLKYLQNIIVQNYETYGYTIIQMILKQFSNIDVIFQFLCECKQKQKIQTLIDFMSSLLIHVFERLQPKKFTNQIKNLTSDQKKLCKILSQIIVGIVKLGFHSDLSNQAMYFMKKIIKVCHNAKFPLFEVVISLNVFETLFIIIRGFDEQEKQREFQLAKFQETWQTYNEEVFKNSFDQMPQEVSNNYTNFNLLRFSSMNKQQDFTYHKTRNLFYGQIYRTLKDIYILRKQEIIKNVSSTIDQKKCLQIANKYFSQIFSQISDKQIALMIQQCHSCKCLRGLASLLVIIIYNDFQKSNKIILAIKRGLKELEAIKFRSFLLLCYYLILMDDQIALQRMEIIKNILEEAYNFNIKYYSQIDLIFQWIMKISNSSQKFAQSLNQSDLYFEISNEHIRHKKPTVELLRKQKISSYQRLNNTIHGIIASSIITDYEKLYKRKVIFLDSVGKSTYHSRNRPSEPPLHQDQNYEDVKGETLYYYMNNKWSPVIVKYQQYNFLKLSKPNNPDEQIGMTWTNDQKLRKFNDPVQLALGAQQQQESTGSMVPQPSESDSL